MACAALVKNRFMATRVRAALSCQVVVTDSVDVVAVTGSNVSEAGMPLTVRVSAAWYDSVEVPTALVRTCACAGTAIIASVNANATANNLLRDCIMLVNLFLYWICGAIGDRSTAAFETCGVAITVTTG